MSIKLEKNFSLGVSEIPDAEPPSNSMRIKEKIVKQLHAKRLTYAKKQPIFEIQA